MLMRDAGISITMILLPVADPWESVNGTCTFARSDTSTSKDYQRN
jgi:hypothetical protein